MNLNRKPRTSALLYSHGWLKIWRLWAGGSKDCLMLEQKETIKLYEYLKAHEKDIYS